MSDALAAIADLREVVSYLERSDSPAHARVVAAMRRYELEAQLGRTLDDVLGLSQRGGAGPWWVQEARARRDEAIRQVWNGFYGNYEVGEAATEIARLAARRMMSRCPPANDKERIIDSALRTGLKFPGRQRLKELMGGEAVERN